MAGSAGGRPPPSSSAEFGAAAYFISPSDTPAKLIEALLSVERRWPEGIGAAERFFQRTQIAPGSLCRFAESNMPESIGCAALLESGDRHAKVGSGTS